MCVLVQSRKTDDWASEEENAEDEDFTTESDSGEAFSDELNDDINVAERLGLIVSLVKESGHKKQD